ncbi:MAG: hypothetical protein ACRCZF_26485, partial [Gemmataceae bacterium]
ITTSVPDRRYNYAIYNAFQIGGPVREMATGTSEKSDAFRKLILAWLDTRKDPSELSNVLNLITSLNIKELSPGKFFDRILAKPEGVQPHTLMMAISTMARARDVSFIPRFEKFITNAGSVNFGRMPGAGGNATALTVGDVALAMILSLRNVDHSQYGFRMHNSANPTAVKFSYSNFYFPSEDIRMFARVKYAWEKTRLRTPAPAPAPTPAPVPTPPKK